MSKSLSLSTSVKTAPKPYPGLHFRKSDTFLKDFPPIFK